MNYKEKKGEEQIGTVGVNMCLDKTPEKCSELYSNTCSKLLFHIVAIFCCVLKS